MDSFEMDSFERARLEAAKTTCLIADGLTNVLPPHCSREMPQRSRGATSCACGGTPMSLSLRVERNTRQKVAHRANGPRRVAYRRGPRVAAAQPRPSRPSFTSPE